RSRSRRPRALASLSRGGRPTNPPSRGRASGGRGRPTRRRPPSSEAPVEDFLREVAAGPVARIDLDEFGTFARADVLREPTPRMEAASARRAHEIRRRSGNRPEFLPRALHAPERPEQTARVRMGRPLEDAPRAPLFDDLARVHDHDAI